MSLVIPLTRGYSLNSYLTSCDLKKQTGTGEALLNRKKTRIKIKEGKSYSSI